MPPSMLTQNYFCRFSKTTPINIMVATVIQEIELDYPIINGSFPISLLIAWQQTHTHRHIQT